MRHLARLVPTAALVAVIVGGGGTVQAGPHAAPSALERTNAAGIDVGRIVETVSHNVSPTKHGTLAARDRLYRAEFDANGFQLRLRSSRFRLETASMNGVLGQFWGLAGNAEPGRAPARAELTERVTARDGELEWDFVLARPPTTDGDLRLQAMVSAAGPPERLHNDWRWPIGRGRVVHMGQLVVRDANGSAFYRAAPSVNGSP